MDGRYLLRRNATKGLILSVIFRGKASSHKVEMVGSTYYVNNKPTTATTLTEVSARPKQQRGPAAQHWTVRLLHISPRRKT